MPVLIIGSGLVGSQAARLEVERGERPVILELNPQPEALGEIVDLNQVSIVPGDVLRPLDLAAVIRREGITHILHTAANTLLTEGAQRNPYAAVELNIMGTLNVLEAARLFGIQRVVLSSSAVLYSSMAPALDPAGGLTEEALPRPGTFYATTKQALEGLGINYAQTFGLDVRMVRYAAVFGPWRGRGGGGGPTQRFRELVERGLRGEDATFPALPPGIEFVYSKDAARGTVLACHAEGLKSRVFNIGMGATQTSESIAEAFRGVVPGARVALQGGITTTAAGPATPARDAAMDRRRAEAELGYRAQYDLRSAFEDYVQFYRERGATRS